MISRLRGTLLSREEGKVEVATPGGVVYEVEVPLSVAERLPPLGREVDLRTVMIVREDVQELYGLLDAGERALFQRLLATKGVGGKNAVNMLSTFPASRLVRVLAERNVAALTQVSGIGKKTAERLVLELSDRMDDLEMGAEGVAMADGTEAAVKALTALGMTALEAERAVRDVLSEEGMLETDELVRKALANR
jgi:holliday junction DNA helicase RuvA